MVAFGLLKIYREKSLSLIPTSLNVPILIFLGWILLTLPFALDPAYSFGEWRKTLTRFLIFFFVLLVVRTQSQAKAILHAFVLGLGLLCLVEVIDFFRIGGDPFSMNIRAGSFFGAHQWLSNYLIMGVPFLWLSWVSQENAWEKGMNYFACAVYPFALFLVHTRSAWLVVLVQFGVFVLYKVTGKFLLSVGIAFLGVVLVIMTLNLSGEFRNLLSKNDFSSTATLEFRFNTWEMALQDIQGSPIVGAGYGKHTFQKIHPAISPTQHTHIHNMFLGTAVQLGLPGMFFLLILFFKILSSSASWLENSLSPDSFNSQFGMAIGLMTLGLIVRNCFDDMFQGTIVYLFLLFVAMGFCLHGRQVRYGSSWNH